ncbi:MAG TPA: CoA transferase, partial [Tepidiformaceae bacterium]|nr:CoA transferase [Tepidiformaceae bacterium]
MAGGALSDVVVLELATGVAGPYCGKLLADLGAQVVKVEPATGDPIRADEPLVDSDSAFFNWLNMNKLGAVLEVTDPRIATLAAHADIVIHAERGEAGDALDAALKRANPRAVIVSLTPYGRSGGRSGWHASALTEWATGGYHYFGGDPNREPIALPGYQ